MDLKAARKINSDITVGSMLTSWKHVCGGHLPGEPPAEKSKYLYTGKEYEKIIKLLLQALGKDKGATKSDYYQDTAAAKTELGLIIVGTFAEPVGTNGGTDCNYIICAVGMDSKTSKPILKTAYPADKIPARFKLII